MKRPEMEGLPSAEGLVDEERAKRFVPMVPQILATRHNTTAVTVIDTLAIWAGAARGWNLRGLQLGMVEIRAELGEDRVASWDMRLSDIGGKGKKPAREGGIGQLFTNTAEPWQRFHQVLIHKDMGLGVGLVGTLRLCDQLFFTIHGL